MGRRSKLTKEITKLLCDEISENGLTLSAASGKHGLAPSTTSKWYDRGRECDPKSPYFQFREAIEVAKARHEASLWENLGEPEHDRKIKSKRDKLNNVIEINTEDDQKILSHSEAMWQLRVRYGYKESDRALEQFQKKMISILEQHLTPAQMQPILKDLIFYMDVDVV